MSTIVTRAGKGSPLTHTEVDNNFTNLNTDKVETSSGTLTNPTINGTVTTTGLNIDSNTLVVDATNNKVILGTTSSVLGKLEVFGGDISITDDTSSANQKYLYFTNGSSTRKAYIGGDFGTAAGGNATQLIFGTNAGGADATEKMRIDSTGNLGLGVTPSAWGSNIKAIDIGTRTALYSGGAGQPLLAYNFYFNGTNNIYKGSYFASAYQQLDGQHQFFTAPSGTAGNAITFTQAMTLDASGNLGIGTTSPNIRAAGETALEIKGSTGRGNLQLNTSAADGTGVTTGSVAYYGGASTSGGEGRIAAISATTEGATANSRGGLIGFSTKADNGGLSERMRITSDGYLRMASGSLGIQFNGDTAAANALDDYEEGTFTPTIIGSTTAGTGTYAANGQIGRYTKIGNRVMFSITLSWTAHTGTGNLRVASLPFTAINITNVYGITSTWCTNIALTASNVMQAVVNTNATQIIIEQYPVGGGASTTVAMDTAGQLIFSGQYEVA
jgi:hypothetical protein